MIKRLHLIPTPIGSYPNAFSLPEKSLEIAANLNTYIVENNKIARSFLKRIDHRYPLNEITMHTLTESTQDHEIRQWLLNSEAEEIGLISDAGCPAIADPGARVVRIAHIINMKIEPWVGPSSIILSMMASGLNGQNFTFRGYAPKKQEERIKKILLWEKESFINYQTQILIETPYRNNHLLEDLIKHLDKKTDLCIASSINSREETIRTLKIEEWKNYENIKIEKKPTIFLYLLKK